MTYTPLTPNAADIISVTQPIIKDNFTVLNNVFDIDHINYVDSVTGDRGKHRKITFVQQSADPTTSVSEIALYTKDVSGVPRLFVREQSDGTVYQMNSITPSVASEGTTWIPGGVVIKWGTFSPGDPSGTVMYPSAFPTTTFVVFLNQTTGNNATNPVAAVGVAASFAFSRLDPAQTYSYLAIGN